MSAHCPKAAPESPHHRNQGFSTEGSPFLQSFLACLAILQVVGLPSELPVLPYCSLQESHLLMSFSLATQIVFSRNMKASQQSGSFLGQYQLGFSMFGDQNVWCPQQWGPIHKFLWETRAMSIVWVVLDISRTPPSSNSRRRYPTPDTVFSCRQHYPLCRATPAKLFCMICIYTCITHKNYLFGRNY